MAIWPNDQERTYLSADEPDGSDDGLEVFPVEVLNTFNSGSLPPHRCTLKVGTPIMLLRNIRNRKRSYERPAFAMTINKAPCR